MASPALRPPAIKVGVLRGLEQLRHHRNRLRQLRSHVSVSNQVAGSDDVPEDVGPRPSAHARRQQPLERVQACGLPGDKPWLHKHNDRQAVRYRKRDGPQKPRRR